MLGSCAGRQNFRSRSCRPFRLASAVFGRRARHPRKSTDTGKDRLANSATVGISIAEERGARSCGKTAGMISAWVAPTLAGAGCNTGCANFAKQRQREFDSPPGPARSWSSARFAVRGFDVRVWQRKSLPTLAPSISVGHLAVFGVRLGRLRPRRPATISGLRPRLDIRVFGVRSVPSSARYFVGDFLRSRPSSARRLRISEAGAERQFLGSWSFSFRSSRELIKLQISCCKFK